MVGHDFPKHTVKLLLEMACLPRWGWEGGEEEFSLSIMQPAFPGCPYPNSDFCLPEGKCVWRLNKPFLTFKKDKLSCRKLKRDNALFPRGIKQQEHTVTLISFSFQERRGQSTHCPGEDYHREKEELKLEFKVKLLWELLIKTDTGPAGLQTPGMISIYLALMNKGARCYPYLRQNICLAW